MLVYCLFVDFLQHGKCGSFVHFLGICYLSERRQLVQIDDKLSELAYVEFGVPQGSILGPVLFKLHVADLQKELDCPCYHYADDTTFFSTHKGGRLGDMS